jgi:hypothetical protein
MFLRRKPDMLVQVLNDSPGDLGWDALAEFVQEVVAQAYPGESPHFESLVAEFRADPRKALDSQCLKAPVGIGIDLAFVTPFVLAAVSFLFGLVADAVKDGAAEAITASTRKKLSALLRRRSNAEPFAPLDAEQEREVLAVLIDRAIALGLEAGKARILAEAVLGALRLRAVDGPANE